MLANVRGCGGGGGGFSLSECKLSSQSHPLHMRKHFFFLMGIYLKLLSSYDRAMKRAYSTVWKVPIVANIRLQVEFMFTNMKKKIIK